jgi:formylglycine-generating enzyme required for sulfatase activity
MLAQIALAIAMLVASSAQGQAESIFVATPAGHTHELVRVPAGEFTMGKDDPYGDAVPVHQVYLDEFYIARCEVTIEQFAAFLNASKSHVGPNGALWINAGVGYSSVHVSSDGLYIPVVEGIEDHPAYEVTWFGADAYCRWAGLRLPTEAEWEKAARGEDAREYPWGNEFNPEAVDYERSSADGSLAVERTAPVGSHPLDASPYGVFDMSGSVMEWVSDWLLRPYPQTGPQTNPSGPPTGERRVLRGGAWNTTKLNLDQMTTWYRTGKGPDWLLFDAGFRCAMGDAVTEPVTETLVRVLGWGELKGKIEADSR